MQSYTNARKGIWISIISYMVLAGSKITIGLWSHSLAVMADGFNNVSDVVMSIALFVGFIIANRPADQDHPFGHHRAESVAVLIAASSMVLVSLDIFMDVIQTFFSPQNHPIHPLAFYISILSAGIMFCVYLFNRHLSKKTQSDALKTAALDNRSDAFVSLGTAVGILGSWSGISWLDPFAAMLVGFIILKTAIELGRPAVHILMDRSDDKKLSRIQQIVHQIEGIQEVKSIRTRNDGKNIFVEMTVGVSPDLSVLKSHAITEEIETQLMEREKIQHVHIHVEPISHNSAIDLEKIEK